MNPASPKVTEAALRETKAALEFILRAAQVGDWDLDLANDTSRRSLRHDQCFGYQTSIPESEWGIEAFSRHLHPDDRSRVIDSLRSAVGDLLDWDSEFRVIWPDGSLHWLAARGSICWTDQGPPTRMRGIVMDITDRKRAEEALGAAEKFARGQFDALRGTLDVLAREPAPERLVEHIMRSITQRWQARSSSFWRRDEAKGMVCFEFAFEDDRIVTKEDPRFAGIDLRLPMEDFWPWPEVFRTGKPSLIEDIRTVPPFALRDRLIPLGITTVLLVPMTLGGRLEGAIGIRFQERRSFRSEEIDLAQALANQAMLALHLTRLSAESRESAVLAERNRMARDIHDTLAQGFTGVIVQLEAAKGAAAAQDAAGVTQRIDRAAALARSSLGEARRSVQALRPPALSDASLFAALDDLLKRMTEGTPLQAAFRVEGTPRMMPPEWEEALFRIAQESLANTMKHARATNFRMAMRFRPTLVELQLLDDGSGFESEKDCDGFGLIGMRERVAGIGGEFTLRTKPGEGVEILVVLRSSSAS